jgi:hypothetical protein
VAELPDRLKRNGRPEDQEFLPPELLFRRYRREDYLGNQFSSLGFAFPKQSVNREKYSVPADVLFSRTDEFEGWGVLRFRVQDLPAAFPPSNPQYAFFPSHVPEDEMYPHSEIWCDRLPRTGEYVEPSSKGVRKLFRAFMSQRARVEIEAVV